MKQTCILILGMHRSGTSALTGTLSELGVYLGSELMAADAKQNSKGFYENNLLYQVNVKLLREISSQWDDLFFNESKIKECASFAELECVLKQEFGGSELFAIKDPRLAYLYPFYVKALTNLGVEIKVIIPYRQPLEVARSLSMRNKFSREKGILLWTYHFVLSEKLSRNCSRVFTSFDELLNNPQAVIKLIDKKLNLGLCERFLQRREEVGEFIAPDLKHHNLSPTSDSPDLPDFVQAIVALLPHLNDLESFEQLDALREDVFAQQKLFYNSDIVEELNGLTQRNKALFSESQSLHKAFEQAGAELLILKDKVDQKQSELDDKEQLVNALAVANKQYVEQQKQTNDALDKITRVHSSSIKSYNLELGLLRRQLLQRDKVYQDFRSAIYQSTSWRLTGPLRSFATNAARLKRLVRLFPSIVKRSGGLTPVIRKAISIYRAEGLRGVRARLAASSVQYNVVHSQRQTQPQPGGSITLNKPELTTLVNRAYAPRIYKAPEHFLQEDTNLKIAVVIHVFYLDVFDSLLERVKNITTDYDLVITVAADKRSETERLLNELGLVAHIIPVENEGYDILPFIQCVPYLLEGQYDLVCKLHTKKGLANLENTFPDVGNIWLDILLNPIMGSQEAVRQVLYAFSNNPQLGMLGAADMYKSSKHLMYGNEVDAARICQLLNPSLDPANPWGFVAGSIFWCKTETLKPLLLLLPMLENAKGVQSQTGSSSSVWHALERVMGLLPRLTGLQTALAYSLDRNGSAVGILSAVNSPLEQGSSYGVGSVLVWYINYSRDLAFLKSTPGFSSDFYFKAYPYVKTLGFDPVQHYLRYGILESCNPNADFSSGYYLNEYADIRAKWLNPFVHYLKYGEKDRRTIFPAQENINKVMGLVNASGYFDREYYLENNPDVLSAKLDPLRHFCLYGWREHRQPCSEKKFDMLWYTAENLKSWLAHINPVLHAVCADKRKKVVTRPKASNFNLAAGTLLSMLQVPKRICLFAGYDRDGIIDDYVVQFIQELNKYADVYYLADGNFNQRELDKLAGITCGAWSIRHGEYDFGSYSRLAKYLVGWSTIRQYDELLLVNDSSYLISSLDPVFSKMDAVPCDWWGLQATKGISATREVESNKFQEKISMGHVLGEMLPDFEKDEVYDFHIGSYFLAFRNPTLVEGGVLQQVLDGVVKEKNKKSVILRYEIGLTRRLLLSGYRPATFIDNLYPFHPIFTKYHFDLVRDGFPLFKRFFLTENHYHVPQLWRWKEWLSEIVPGLDLSAAEKNLQRICDANRLYRNLHIPEDQDDISQTLLTKEQFVAEDRATAKDDYCWVFPVCAYDEMLGANERMLFEAVKDNPKIKKIILYRGKSVLLNGDNVEYYPLQSLEGQRALINSRYIFIKHAPTINLLHPVDGQLHRIINLWHGIPLKRIGYASLDQVSQLQSLSEEHARCHAVIASSKIDRLAMAAAFYPLSYHDIWTTGLPRNDVIVREEASLPADFQEQLVRLRELLAGRRLVLFAPTFRNAQGIAYYPFSETQRQALFDCLNRYGAVLGIREHMADLARSYSVRLADKGAPIVSLDRRTFADIELLYREADLLITDYSSCFIDFMLTGKPEICFAYDYESYSETERGLFYELEDVFPGPVCFEFEAMLKSLDEILSGQVNHSAEAYKFKTKLFFDFVDDNNSQRLVEYIERDIEGASS